MATKYSKDSKGYYQTKVWDGSYNANGTKHRITIRTKKSSKELERKVNEFILMRDNRELTHNTDITFIDYARQWLNIYKNTKEKGTQNMYKSVIEDTLADLYGSLKLRGLQPIHIQTPISLNADYPRKCQFIYMTQKQICQQALNDSLITAAAFNALFKNVELPRYRPKENRPLTKEESEAIFRANFTPKEKTFVYLLYFCGLRRGEALALTPFDIDFKRSEININKSLAFDGNTPYIKAPKTPNSYRTVPMPEILQTHLKVYIRSCGKYLFDSRGEDTMTKSSYRKFWNSIIKKMKNSFDGEYPVSLDNLTAHKFRHNYCTNLCYQMPIISIKKIAQLLGDTDKMVINVYNHIILEKEDAKGAIEAAFNLR